MKYASMKQGMKSSRSVLKIVLLHYYSVISIIIFILSLFTDWYIPLSLILSGVTILMVIDRLGKGIVLRELIALHSIVVCLFMPVLGYLMYTRENYMARLWLRYMPISEAQYFSYTLPAMAAFVAALCWPIDSEKTSDQGTGLQKILTATRSKLSDMPKVGTYLIVVGTVMFFVTPMMPDFLRFVTTLIYWSSFAGVLYVYFTGQKRKWQRVVLWIFATIIVVNAIQTGMFTIVAYMGITLFSFFFVGKKTNFFKKVAVFFLAGFMLVLIQSVKNSYRYLTWRQGYEGNKVLLFARLVVEKWNNTENFFESDAFFPIYYRTNQGFNVSLVMRRFPAIQPFDGGSNQLKVLASAFVPRLFWPDKPEAGGKFNMKYYTGITIRGWSTNVGPLGEAYGSFGPQGGIIFMIVLAAFIRFAYKKVFTLSRRVPLLIFWLPVLFYQITYSAESDTLQILNSLLKSAFFIWLLIRLLPTWFGLAKKSNDGRLPFPKHPPQSVPNPSLQ